MLRKAASAAAGRKVLEMQGERSSYGGWGGNPPKARTPPGGGTLPPNPRPPQQRGELNTGNEQKKGGPPEKDENIKEFANSSNNPVKTGAFAQKPFFRRKLEHLALLKGFEDQA